MQGFAPADETLLFRQKCPKQFPPVCGPKGVPPPTPRIRWRENSLCSNNSRRKVDSGLRLRRIRRRDAHKKKDLQSINRSSSAPQLPKNYKDGFPLATLGMRVGKVDRPHQTNVARSFGSSEILLSPALGAAGPPPRIDFSAKAV